MLAGGVDERDALGPFADVSAHLFVPEVEIRAGGRVRALGKDHQLFVVGVFV